ncbi:MAG: hypothetical protein AB1499_17445 [Nitrospirota bacterium]
MKKPFQHRQHIGESGIFAATGQNTGTLQLIEEILSGGSLLRIRVTGRSMTPLLQGREFLTLRQVACSALKKGDLILFSSNGRLILHRIICKFRSGDGSVILRTQGDAMTSDDGPVHQEKVLGKVILIEKSCSKGRVIISDMESAGWVILNSLIATAIPIRMRMRRILLNIFMHIPLLQTGNR